ncbi:hypothetical protein EST38_g2575 [Candolleomyces aberdarensis]|uniref:J domain-containing protein n=1 Tax=Candolleomyces aberdarensis TaxID=2316362 RepID=A0A4Q2DT57_9AGAR|nr:hypothetical protein EST38_g2575 [Candolleomyces aberdarensis]
MPSRTPFQTLGVSPQSTADEIKHAYRALILKWHPDRYERDKAMATKRFIEINEAYKQLTEALELESNFEEPIVMNNDAESRTSSIDRQSSRSSSEYSGYSEDSYGLRRTRSFDSGFQTTPSSSFKESPTHSYFPKPSFPAAHPAAYRPDPHPSSPTSASPRHETWRTGSDLPDGFRHHIYSNSPRLSHPRPRASSIPKPPPPSAAAYTGGTRNIHAPYCALPPSAVVPRLSHSVIPPQPSSSHHHSHSNSTSSSAHHIHPGSGADKRYHNHLGDVFVQPSSSSGHGTTHHIASPYDVPLVSIGLGQSGEWTYALPLSLEELFTGIHLTLPITRRLLSGRSRTVTLELDIPAGCRKGSKLVCKRVGHEVKHGVFQDIAFIIEDKVHSRFRRECDDLHVEMRVPLVENLREFGGEVPLVGVDGQLLVFFIDFPRHGAMEGRNIIKGGGMPSRHGGKVVGKGNMIVDWEIVPSQPKKVMGFVKRFWRK